MQHGWVKLFRPKNQMYIFRWVAGIDLHEVGKRLQTRDRLVEHDLRAFDAALRQVRSGQIPDEEEVGREDAPGILAAAVVRDQEIDLLRAVARGMEDLQGDLTHADSVAPLDPARLVVDLGELGEDQLAPGGGGEAAGTGDMVGVAVRVDDVADRRGLPFRELQVGLDVPEGIEDGAASLLERAHHVGDAPGLTAKNRFEPHGEDSRWDVRRVVKTPSGRSMRALDAGPGLAYNNSNFP